jgi:ABC-2 type transport system permease protein
MIASFTDSMEGFNLILSFIVLPMFLLSGALFPISGLPEWLQFAVYLNPLTYGVDALRAAILHVSALPLYIDIAVLVAFATATVLAASYLFTKREQGLM